MIAKCLLSADETKDNSKKELLSIVLRYFSNMEEMIVEHFIGFTYLHGLGAQSITQYDNKQDSRDDTQYK